MQKVIIVVLSVLALSRSQQSLDDLINSVFNMNTNNNGSPTGPITNNNNNGQNPSGPSTLGPSPVAPTPSGPSPTGVISQIPGANVSANRSLHSIAIQQ